MLPTSDRGIEFLLLVAMFLDGGLVKAQLKAIKSNLEGLHGRNKLLEKRRNDKIWMRIKLMIAEMHVGSLRKKLRLAVVATSLFTAYAARTAES